MQVGCVNLDSEGGSKDLRQGRIAFSGVDDSFFTTNNGDIGTVAIALRFPKAIDYNGNEITYTRDAFLTKVEAFCRGDEIGAAIYRVRGVAASAAFDPVFDASGAMVRNSFVDKILGGTDAGGTPNVPALQTAFEAFGFTDDDVINFGRANNDEPNALVNPDDELAEERLVAGDFIFMTVIPDAGTDATWATIFFSEEV